MFQKTYLITGKELAGFQQQQQNYTVDLVASLVEANPGVGLDEIFQYAKQYIGENTPEEVIWDYGTKSDLTTETPAQEEEIFEVEETPVAETEQEYDVEDEYTTEPTYVEESYNVEEPAVEETYNEEIYNEEISIDIEDTEEYLTEVQEPDYEEETVKDDTEEELTEDELFANAQPRVVSRRNRFAGLLQEASKLEG